MNKKGFTLGNTITTIATIIVLIFIMGSFVMISAGISTIKRPEIKLGSLLAVKPHIPEFGDIKKEETILDLIVTSRIDKEKFEEITDRMKNDKSLSDQQIQELRKQQTEYSQFLSKYKTQIADELAELNKNTKQEKCFLLIEKQTDIENNRLTENEFDLTPVGRDIYIKIKNGIATVSGYENNMDVKYAKSNLLVSMPTFAMNLGEGKTKTVNFAYYYGVCQ